MKRLHGKEEEEIRRILARLSGMRDNAAELKENIAVLAELDFIFCQRSSEPSLGCFLEPIPTIRGSSLEKAAIPCWEKVRSPLIWKCQKNFPVLLSPDPIPAARRFLLKIAGLFVLMAQAGLHLPTADRSKVAVFRGIYADIGDEQSIEQSFEYLLLPYGQYCQYLGKGGKKQLVVLDELGGNRPGGRAALAMAIIDTLLAKGAKVIITTH